MRMADFGWFIPWREKLPCNGTNETRTVSDDAWKVRMTADIVKRDINANLSKTIVLSDCGISFRRKALRYALNLNNIFNQRHYSYSEYNMVNTYSFNYDLRGRELLFSITFTKWLKLQGGRHLSNANRTLGFLSWTRKKLVAHHDMDVQRVWLFMS